MNECVESRDRNECFHVCSVIQFAIEIWRPRTHANSAKGVVNPTPDYDHCLYLLLFSFVYFFSSFSPCTAGWTWMWYILFCCRCLSHVLALFFRKIKMSVAFAHTQTHTKTKIYEIIYWTPTRRWPFPVAIRRQKNILNIYFLNLMNWIESTEIETGIWRFETEILDVFFLFICEFESFAR